MPVARLGGGLDVDPDQAVIAGSGGSDGLGTVVGGPVDAAADDQQVLGGQDIVEPAEVAGALGGNFWGNPRMCGDGSRAGGPWIGNAGVVEQLPNGGDALIFLAPVGVGV